ncbi:hypothetical protein IGI04_019425 [Brassica rapa subsp. trilocularis]|uniref:Uncharacterized protein n=1 Tax=Brassica rapa subsp. trilocularis TaxID=1813537 RepID=A0ABQ7MJ81_BRACM|nr:hypothetical protein IGI04_019425 [Brassica rapa subsp. trilocularis]
MVSKSLRRQTPADLEPSERDIGELSQPPSTEIRSVTPPPSHPLGHQCVRDVETSPEQEFQPEIRRDAPTRAGGSSARESHAPPSPPDIRRSNRSRPLSVRRREAAAGDFPVSHHRRWSPPATGLRRLAGRLAAGVHSYHFSTLLRGSETSGLAMLLVRACGAETFVSWTLLERAGKSLRRQTPADLEPSERDIGELSQPPSTEIRSVTPPPSHPLGHQCVRDVETSPEQEFQPEIRRDAPTRAGGSSARESHAPPSPPDIRRSNRSRPLSVRRREAAAGDFPVSHHRRWPPPATGLRRLAGRLAAGVHSYHFSTLLRGSETSGLAMLLVRACGAETFVSWTLLERAGVRLTSRSDCYRIGALGVLFFLFSDFRFYDFIDISGFISFIAFMVIYWIYDFGVDF